MTQKIKFLTPDEAVGFCKQKNVSVSTPTIIQWCRKYGIGHQLGGKGSKWVIHPAKLLRFLNGTY